MLNVTFVTGNQDKAAYLARLLGVTLKHQKLELDELQSLDLAVIAEHKARQAFDMIGSPVLIEDVSLTFHALGRLPGPFIKWFEELGHDGLCNLLNGYDNRFATVTAMFAYYDGKTMRIFKKSLDGRVAGEPRGSGGFGWDDIFIPEGYTKTRAELSPEEDAKNYRQMKPLDELKAFLLKK